ncbi:glucose-1-phosphate cytidylyltransferase [Candidatus Woesearchaeota archaeon]|nr:glucose-1-phosphate cytidylyltransferase [Candidatus Woesearchaeota archaeon]
MEKPKVVILCGGQGTRLREETEFKPKPLVNIGNLPILWHIMKIYSHYGFNDFVLCLGYKGDMIKRFFMDLEWKKSDFTLNLKSKSQLNHSAPEESDWNVTFAETGLTANTGARIKRIQKYINEDNFFLTYGDGVADIDINQLLNFHKSHSKIGTVTAVRPLSRFGLLTMKGNQVLDFTKKYLTHDGWIDGGFFVFKKEMFDYLSEDENCMLEREPLHNLAKDNQFMAYQHTGYWQCMDTMRQVEILNELWKKGDSPWRVWK